MKNIFLLLTAFFLFNITLNACEGDCVMCHPKLLKENGKMDKDHAILVTCKTCHTQEEMEKIDMGSGCGQDCWSCHDIKKVTASKVKEHNNLQTCIDCHVTLDKNMFGGAGGSTAFSDMGTLDELMSGGSITMSDEINETTIKNEINKTAKVETKVEEKPKETKELNVEVKKSDEVGLWEKISNFFKDLWQSIVSIFA